MPSKYETIKKSIQNEIQHEIWKEGEKIPPQRELEAAYQVSRITVKKAIADLIAQGILEHQNGRKGIFVRKRQQRSSQRCTIAVSLDDITSHYDSNLLKGIEDSLWKRNYHTIICNANRDMRKVEAYFHSFDFSKVDGIIYLPVIDTDYIARNRKIIQLFKDNRTPFVLIDQSIPGTSTNIVSTDHRNAAMQLCLSLIDRGHTKILVGQGLDCPSVRERFAGVKDAMEAKGIALPRERVLSINDSLIRPREEPDPREMEKIEEQIRAAGEFTAFYAVNNRVMKAVVLTLVKMGYPMDRIQLALHNEVNKPVHPFTDRIPFIDPHLYEMGFEAANLLFKVMETEEEDKTYQLIINSHISLDGLQ